MKMIQEEATTADNSIKTKRKLMKHRHKVESSAQSPSLSGSQRARQLMITPTLHLHSRMKPLQSVIRATCRGSLMGGWEGEQMLGP